MTTPPNQNFTIEIPAQMAKVSVVIGDTKYIRKYTTKAETPLTIDEQEILCSDGYNAMTRYDNYIQVIIKTQDVTDFDLVRTLTHEMVHVADLILNTRKVQWKHLNEIYPHMIGYLVSDSMKRIKQ